MKNGFKYALIAMILALLMIFVSVAFVFMPRKFSAFDMTSGSIHSISNTTKTFLAELDRDVTIYVIDADTTQKKFEEYIKRYAECSDKITVEYVNSSKNKEISAMLSEYGFSEAYPPTAYSLLICSEERTQFVDFSGLFTYSNATLGFTEISSSYYNYYMQLFSSSADYADYLNTLVADTVMNFHGEMALTQLIEYVAADIIPQAYFVTGHGEDSVTDGKFAALLAYYGYAFGVYELSGEAAVPKDAACIIINEPKEDYTDAEVDILLDYLKSGGNMLLILSPDTNELSNLSVITEHCGFSVIDGIVMEDEKASEDAEALPSKTVAATLNIDHDVFASAGIDAMDISGANAIEISKDLRKAQLVTPIVTTSDETYIEGSEERASFTIGVAVEEETELGNMRVVCFTGAQSFNSEDSTTDALTLPVCALSWIAEGFESEIGEIAPSVYQDKYLSISQEKAVYLGLMFVIVVPACIIAYGVTSCKNRKKK